jgi:hypothetical protein
MKMGAPLFAHFAKGGTDAAGSAGFDFPEDLIAHTASYPPLHKTQERGTRAVVALTTQSLGHPPENLRIYASVQTFDTRSRRCRLKAKLGASTLGQKK